MGLTLFTRRVRLSTDGSGYSLENSGKGYVSKGTNNIILFCLETELLHPTQGTTLSIILDYFLPSLFTSVPIDLPVKHIWNAQFFFSVSPLPQLFPKLPSFTQTTAIDLYWLLAFTLGPKSIAWNTLSLLSPWLTASCHSHFSLNVTSYKRTLLTF